MVCYSIDNLEMGRTDKKTPPNRDINQHTIKTLGKWKKTIITLCFITIYLFYLNDISDIHQSMIHFITVYFLFYFEFLEPPKKLKLECIEKK